MKRGKGRNGLLPHSLRIISSCLKTVSTNAGTVASTVRSAGASVVVAASSSLAATDSEEEKDQVLWAGFDKLELPSSFKHVLLLGYANGFQVLDVDDASNVCELVSKRDGPVTFLQVQPTPIKSVNNDGFRASHPLLLVVAGDETNGSGIVQGGRLSALIKETVNESAQGSCMATPTVVRFYSLKSHSYVHALRFRSAVYVVRCSPRIVAVALAAQIYCFDAVTLENKFSVLTYPLQGPVGVNTGYGPMAVGPRWLAYASNNPLITNTGRLSPQNLTPSPGVSPSTSPGNGNLVARYAMESSKHLAAGIINLGDMGYKTLSKYCQELLPDGSSSPLSSNSGRKSGKLSPTVHPSETDNAGMVLIKDFTSKEIISQFRAHTSPISALCFDPSGTLLVTASVHGHNINIFRIMPSRMQNGSNPAHNDWASSHVHLYKLYRGLTAAVIQDISFSHFSQWIAVVSSRGTCHIYVLSPFGGDASLQLQNSHSDRPVLTPNLTMPWWSTSCCAVHQQIQSPPPPPPVTYSVISRIKNSNSGWLNTVSNVAATAAGKIPVPSGAIAAVFHNIGCRDALPVPLKASALEHLLVYSPSGHVIQHRLLRSPSDNLCDNSRAATGSFLQFQDEELNVTAEPVQWWDVCRRLTWPEREEEITRILCSNEKTTSVLDPSDCEVNKSLSSMSSTNSNAKLITKTQDRSHLYLSSAEVQISTGRVPVWQKSKIFFFAMTPRTNELSSSDINGGEIEIEMLQLAEVEIRRKDLLPAFENFVPRSDSNGRTAFQSSGYYLSSISDKAENCDTGIISGNFNSASESFGSRTPKDFLDPDGKCKAESGTLVEKPKMSFSNQSIYTLNLVGNCTIVNQLVHSESQTTVTTASPCNGAENDPSLFHFTHCDGLMDGSIANGVLSNCLPTNDKTLEDSSYSNHISNDEVSTPCSTKLHMEQPKTSDSLNSVEFSQYFNEGCCKVSELDDCRELTEAVTDMDSNSSHCERERPEEDGDKDDILGGIFIFSEEG